MLLIPFLMVIYGLFASIKYSFLTLRFSDTNIYFYTAGQMLRGHLLYRDIFFTNFPLFPAISSLYRFILGNNIELYYLTSTLEAMVIATLLFLIVLRETKDRLLAFLSLVSYLFSFSVLATSDHQTGVFTTSIFLISAYLCFRLKKSFFSGLCLALAFMTKAYSLPVVVAFVVYAFLRERKTTWHLLLGIGVGTGAVLIPVFLQSSSNFIADVWGYSLFRLAGLSKLHILSFFVTHDPFLFVLFLVGVFTFRKQLLLSFILIFSFIFVLLYQDIYYLYLQIFVPFLILIIPSLLEHANRWGQSARYVIWGMVFLALSFSTLQYISNYSQVGKIAHVEELTRVVLREKPLYLYGGMEVTPLLSELTGVPLLPGVSDTNESIFRKRFLDAKKLTRLALGSRTIIVAKGLFYPALRIDDPLTDSVYVKDEVKKSCVLLTSQPVRTEGTINRINLFRCY